MRILCLVISIALIRTQADCEGPRCESSLFSGFDSRLLVRPVGRFPGEKENIVGFEIHKNKPVVAYPHRLLMIDGDHIAELPSEDEMQAIAVSAQDKLLVQTASGILEPSGNKLVRSTPSVTPFLGQIHNSGNKLYLDVVANTSGFQANVRSLAGRSLPLVGQPDQPLRTISWNDRGLAVVYGTSLLIWISGAPAARVLINDAGLSKATAACVVGNNRVVVGVGNATVLVTEESQLILVGGRTRCQMSGDSLYLLDEVSRIVWKIDGMQQVGIRTSDLLFARKLLYSLSSASSPETDARFREAARILGCREAEQYLKYPAR